MKLPRLATKKHRKNYALMKKKSLVRMAPGCVFKSEPTIQGKLLKMHCNAENACKNGMCKKHCLDHMV